MVIILNQIPTVIGKPVVMKSHVLSGEIVVVTQVVVFGVDEPTEGELVPLETAAAFAFGNELTGNPIAPLVIRAHAITNNFA